MNQRRRPARGRPPAPTGQGTSAGARGALLLGVAVILGIVLLQKFDTTSIGTGSAPATSVVTLGTTTTTRRVGLTTVATTPVTTAKARAKGEVRVLVANGAGVRGLGAATTTALKNVGYNTLTPTDATTAVDKTAVQFADGYEAEAREVATSLSLPGTVVTRLASPPVAASDLDDAKVVVILGADVATTTSAPATTSTTRRP